MGLSPSDAALAFYRIPTIRIAYTFGSDEVSQTVTTFNPSTQAVLTTEVHTFGHDGHGSVRVLFDAASKLAQAYTYGAYGGLLAIHNGLGASPGNAASSALTSMLYNGESFDGCIGQLHLRARWYDGHRFTTIDPYAGDASNPMSFNKFGFVHADPIQGVDPTGRENLGSIGTASSIGTSLIAQARRIPAIFVPTPALFKMGLNNGLKAFVTRLIFGQARANKDSNWIERGGLPRLACRTHG